MYVVGLERMTTGSVVKRLTTLRHPEVESTSYCNIIDVIT